MKKRMILFTIILSLSLSVVLANEDNLSNFSKIKQYENNFEDVSTVSWYYENVKTAYEMGLVNGKSDINFVPNGNITLAETITLASRIHNTYHNNNYEFNIYGNWYDTYVDYAIKEEIITSKQFDNYNKFATRSEFASIMANSVPSEALNEINEINSIPDVSKQDTYAKPIYLLYNAGILSGNDEYGTFSPNSNIQRSEVAAIVVRLADKTQRKKITLKEKEIEVENVVLSKTSLSITVGDTETLKVTILPSNATNNNVEWESSNTNVATVKSGKVKAVSEGTTIITVISDNYKTAECKVTVEKQSMLYSTVYEDSKVKIDFVSIEKSKRANDRAEVYFDLQNKTDETIKIQCDALSINGYLFNQTIMSDDVAGKSTGTINTTLKNFDFDLVDITDISTVGGQFRIISDNKSFKTYDALFTNIDVYDGGSTKKYPSVKKKELLYTDDKLNIYFDYAENEDERVEVYLTVQNKTSETITIQNDTVVIGGRSYNKTVMSDTVLPYTTGNVNVTVKDISISSDINTIGGQFRIISDTKSFKTYDAVLGQKTTESDNYYDDENEYEDNEKNDDKNNNESNNQIDYENESGIINTQYSVTYNKLKSQIMSKGTKTSSGKYMIVNFLTSELTVNLCYDPTEKYIGYMLIDLSDSDSPVTSTLFLYEDSAPAAMLVSTGNVKATVMGEYSNSEIKIISSTYPSANTAAIKAINASYKIFDTVAELNGIDIKIKDFGINY